MNSKMTSEQRRIMKGLNDGAKKRLAVLTEEQSMTHAGSYDPNDINTPFKEAHGEEIAVPKAGPGEVGKGPRHTVPQVTNYLRYTQDTLAAEFKRIFDNEIMALRDAGQKEYAHDDSSPFANFERAAADTGLRREQVLWIFAMKHKDGIAAALKGHTSQREAVRGRINDLIVYLLLYRGMLNENAGNTGNFGLGELDEAGD